MSILGYISTCDIRIGDSGHRRVICSGEVEPLIGSVAARLWASGVRPGQVVVYQGPQQASAFVLFWACVRNGAVFAPVDEAWPAFQLANAAERLAPRLVVSTSKSVAAAMEVFPNAEHLWLEPEAELSDLDALARWARREHPIPAVEIADSAPAAYLFTSGTNGVPKAVVHSRASLAHSARVTIEALGWQAGERLVNLPDPHTMSGLRNAFLAAPMAGMDWIPQPERDRPNLVALLDQLERARCHRLVAGPLFLRQLALLGDRVPRRALSSLKAIYSTGAALNPASATALYERFGVPVINYYGLTETGGICLSQRLEDWRAGDQTLGYPVGCEARLVGEDGKPVVDGQEGELLIRSPQLMTGYLDDSAATAERLERGWLRTGDLVLRLADGRYDLVGRASQFINTLSTERVHPEEIEKVLERHACVAEAAVFGRAEDGGGERIAALIVARSGGPAADDLPIQLADFVAGHLGAARRPSLVRVVAALPRHGNGKLIRHRLQDLD